MNELIDKALDQGTSVVSKLDTEKYLGLANKYIEKFIAYAILGLGALSMFLFILALCMSDSERMVKGIGSKIFYVIPVTLIAAVLTPKLLQLLRSLVEKSTADSIRPEVATILKLGAIGCLVWAIAQLCLGEVVAAIIGLLDGVLSMIVLSKPESFGVKYETPSNAVDEIVSLIRLPFRVVLKLISPVAVIAIVCLVVSSIATMCDVARIDYLPHGYAPLSGAAELSGGIGAILGGLFGAYIVWTLAHVVIDILRSIASRANKAV